MSAEGDNFVTIAAHAAEMNAINSTQVIFPSLELCQCQRSRDGIGSEPIPQIQYTLRNRIIS